MATNKDILNDVEIVKDYLIRSDLSDEQKRIYLRLINTSKIATNGISYEEKIQKLTDCMIDLVMSHIMQIKHFNEKVQNAITNANTSQCKNCKAMKHAEEVEKEQREKDLINDYLEKAGIKNGTEQKPQNMSWQDILKQIALKPYAYVVICLITISPYSVDIIKTIMAFFDK